MTARHAVMATILAGAGAGPAELQTPPSGRPKGKGAVRPSCMAYFDPAITTSARRHARQDAGRGDPRVPARTGGSLEAGRQAGAIPDAGARQAH